MARIAKRWRSACLIATVVIYFVLASHDLSLPGVYYDELLQVLPAMSAAGYNVGNEFYQVPGSILRFGNIQLPLMIMPYTGPFETFIFTLLFVVFPPTVITVRVTFIVLGIVALILTFLATRRAFGFGVAIIASLLLASDAGYIFYSRADIGPVNTMMIVKMLMLLALTSWWLSGKQHWFYIGAFLGGLGIYDKANFAWLLIAGGLVLFVFGFKEVMERLRYRRKMLFIGTLCFALGAGPFIGYVFLSGGGPFSSFASSFEKTDFGVKNLHIMENFGRRAVSLWNLLSGYLSLREYNSGPTGQGIIPERWFALQPYVLVLAAAAPVWLYLRRRIQTIHLRITLGLAALIVMMLFLSIFTPTTLSNNHLLLIYPFPHILIAYAAVLTWNAFDPRTQNIQTLVAYDTTRAISRMMRSLVVLIITFTLMSNFRATAHVYRALETAGGIGMWSSAIYELNDYLESQDRNVVCMDWGLCYNLLFLSQGRLNATDRWRQFLYPGSDLSQMETLMRGNSLFVFHSPAYTGVLEIAGEDYPRQAFFETARKLNAQARRLKVIEQGNGEPVFEVYELTLANELN